MIKVLVLMIGAFCGLGHARAIGDPDCDNCYRILYQTTQPGKHLVYYATDLTNWVPYPGQEMFPSTVGGDYDKDNGWFEFQIPSSDIPFYPRWFTNLKYVVGTEYNGQIDWQHPREGGNFGAWCPHGYWAIQNLKYQSPLQLKKAMPPNSGDTQIRVQYATAPFPFVYYRACGGEWPKDRGVPMIKARDPGTNCDFDEFHFDFNMSCVELAFHDGHDHWDSNNGKNYRIDKPGVWNFYDWLPRTGRSC